MLRTLPSKQTFVLPQRVALIAAFTVLLVVSAKVEVWFGSPVPFTLQVMVVLLAGMVLGARDGAISVLSYLGLILMNLPVDSAGIGSAAFAGATAGYLVGFVPAAFVAGWLVEKSAGRVWQRWLAGLVGVVVIYAFGLPVLASVAGADLSRAWELGGAPFLGLDVLKALLAALIVEAIGRYTKNQPSH